VSSGVELALTLGQVHPGIFEELTVEADRLGFESIWLPEHLVFPVEIRGQLVPGEEHPPVPSTVPVFDACAYLSYLAAKTSQIRLGTFVYLLGLRHPFVSARGFATLDIVSGGRAEVGVGAGWLETEWEAVGLDFSTRGKRLDEAIDLCRRLWTEPTIESDGPFFPFAPVAFEPKPVQQTPPIAIGGESKAALRRAARRGDGWIGMHHTPTSAAAQVAALRGHEQEVGRSLPPVKTTVMGEVSTEQPLAAWEEAGVDRLIVVPWTRTREALDGIRRFADQYL
jgi:probable F420-dependent oxidoreductase